MNLYELLGISRESTQEEIKDAFRKKAILCHPDKGGDPKEFNEVRTAYEILMDNEKRKTYDLTGEADPNFDPDKDALELTKVIIRRVLTSNQNDMLKQAICLCTAEVAERQKVQKRLNEQNEFINCISGKIKQKRKVSKESQEKINKKEFDKNVMDEILEANKIKFNVFDEAFEEFRIELEADISRISKDVLVAQKAFEIIQDYEFIK